MSSKLSLSPSSKANTTTPITGVTTRRIISKKNHQLSASSTASSHVKLSDATSLLKVKKEPPDDEIKEYAANAMSELLGWYGYDKVDSGYTRGLNLDHFSSSTSPQHGHNYRLHHHRYHNQQQQQQFLQRQLHHHSQIINANFVNSKNFSTNGHRQTKTSPKSPQSRASHSPSTSSISVVSNKESDVAYLSPPVSLTTAPASPRALEHSDSASDAPDCSTTCSWCGRTGGTWEPGSAALTCGFTNNSSRFCSETCFAAGRRAAFKRARTCDWCRHVRHSVSYVDFQDGESQLQFCSDKCLNQYKMNIFCRETQAHLALHGLATISSNNSNISGGLITPELWLRDCRSPSPNSPEDEALVVDDEPTGSPVENIQSDEFQIEPGRKLLRDENKQSIHEAFDADSSAPQLSHILDDTGDDTFHEETEEAIKESLKDEEERKIKNCTGQDSLVKSTHAESDTLDVCKQSQTSQRSLKESSIGSPHEGTIYLKDVQKLLGNDAEKLCCQAPVAANSRSQNVSKSSRWYPEIQMNYQSSLRDDTVQHPILSHSIPYKYSPRTGNFPGSSSVKIENPPLHYLHEKVLAANSQSGLLPPVTVLVPYPIPIPIPLPIPIPIPLFGKPFSSHNYNSCEAKKQDSGIAVATDTDVDISVVPEDLSQRAKTTNLQKKNTVKQIQSLNVDDGTATLSDSSTSSSPILLTAPLCPSFSNSKIIDGLPIFPNALTNSSSKPLRKKRRQPTTAEQTDAKVKRRSKFVPV